MFRLLVASLKHDVAKRLQRTALVNIKPFCDELALVSNRNFVVYVINRLHFIDVTFEFRVLQTERHFGGKEMLDRLIHLVFACDSRRTHKSYSTFNFNNVKG